MGSSTTIRQSAAPPPSPANIVLPARHAVEPQPLSERSLNAAMIVEVDLVRGLGNTLRMDVIEVAGHQDRIPMSRHARAGGRTATHDSLANINARLGGHDGNCG